MSQEEAALVLDTVRRWEQPPALTFSEGPNGTVSLEAAPCPLLGADGRCRIYDIRPYVCRRFACGRVDVATEAYEPEVYAPDLGLYGCTNLSDRVRESSRFRAHVETLERHAMKWGRDHGWRRS